MFNIFLLYDAFVISSSNWSTVTCVLTLDRTQQRVCSFLWKRNGIFFFRILLCEVAKWFILDLYCIYFTDWQVCWVLLLCSWDQDLNNSGEEKILPAECFDCLLWVLLFLFFSSWNTFHLYSSVSKPVRLSCCKSLCSEYVWFKRNSYWSSRR